MMELEHSSTAVELQTRSRKTIRLRVRRLFEKQNVKQMIPREFQPMIDKNNTLAFRMFWAVLIGVCIFIYSYQMYDRISYFLDSPTTVDVFEEKIQTIKFPAIHVCVPLNQYVLDYYNLSGMTPNVFDALNPMDKLIQTSDVDLAKLWNLNYSHNFVHNTFMTDERRQEKINILLNITLTLKLNPRGTCVKLEVNRPLQGSEIYGRLSYDIIVPELVPGNSIIIAGITLPLDFQYNLYMPSETHTKIGTFFRTYHFINTRNKPCVQMDEYIECGNKCLETTLDKNPCWLPYRPRYSKGRLLQLCNNSETTLSMNKENLFASMGQSPQIDCGCSRSCENLYNNAVFEFERNEPGVAKATHYLREDHTTVLKERLIYDLISLLSDFGGNMGLWLGLSFLSFIDLIWIVAKWYKIKPIHFDDRMTKRIEECFKTCGTTSKTDQPTSNMMFLKKTFSYLIYLCFFGLGGFLVQQRIQLYVTEPIQKSVLIKEPPDITFPNIIICAGLHNAYLIEIKREYLEWHKQNDTKCNIDLLDLVNWKGLTVSDLWDLTYMKPLDNELIKLFSPYPERIFDVRTYTKLPSPHGICIKHSFGSLKYRSVVRFLDAVEKVTDNPLCKPDFTDAYVTPVKDPNLSIDLNSAYPTAFVSASFLSRRNVHNLNTKYKPCNSNSTEYYRCKSECIENKIKSKQLCSMPFAMKKDTAFCNTSETAKAVRTLYYKIHGKTNVLKECLCQPLCKQPFYILNEFAAPITVSISSFVFIGFPTNKIETIAEELKYSFVALVSDIGNISGLVLGLSVITAINFVQKYAISFTKKK